MTENQKLIKQYILLVIKNFSPKNEEFIHSFLFLLSLHDKELIIKDWYSNGYSVLSETVASNIKELCAQKKIFYSSDGTYKTNYNLQFENELVNRIKAMNNTYRVGLGGYRMINEAIKKYKNFAL